MKNTLSILCLIILFGCVDAANNERGQRQNRNNIRAAKPDSLVQVMRPQAYRTKGSKQLSYQALSDALRDNSSDLNYRFIPDPQYDNDETVTITSVRHNNCGKANDLDTVRLLRNNCLEMNSSSDSNSAEWLGEKLGIAGESTWYLIHNNNNQTKVWQDTSTGMLWTHAVGKGSWSEASGSGVDAAKYICGNLSILPVKGIVKWMLPTRNEFLLADINGARYILPDTENSFWTSSKVPGSSNAWAIKQNSGILFEADASDPNTILDVRCVGVPIR